MNNFVYEMTVKVSKEVFELIAVIIDEMGFSMPTKFDSLLVNGQMTINIGITKEDWAKIAPLIPAYGKVVSSLMSLVEAASVLEDIEPVTTINGMDEAAFIEKVVELVEGEEPVEEPVEDKQ